MNELSGKHRQIFCTIKSTSGKQNNCCEKNKPLASSYDAVIINGGEHALSTPCFLTERHGMNNITMIGKGLNMFGG